MTIFNVTVQINMSEVVDTFTSELDEDKMFQLIVDLDKEMQSWDFTKRLFFHFKDEMLVLQKLEEGDNE